MTTSLKRFSLALAAAVTLVFVTHGLTGLAAAIRTVQMQDACDPQTFNAAFGEGTCVRNGGVNLDVFINQLIKHGSVGAWHFAPDPVRLKEGDRFQAKNHGGEVHTFTEVDEFGGGFVQELNDILGLTPTPECAALAQTNPPAGLVFPGESTDPEEEEAGVHHYQCCIHPWMRTDVIVR